MLRMRALLLLLLMIALVACSDAYKRPLNTASADYRDLRHRFDSSVQDAEESARTPFALGLTIEAKEDNLIYRLKLSSPEHRMHDVVLSFMLPPAMIDVLPMVFHSSYSSDFIVDLDPATTVDEYETACTLPILAGTDRNFEQDYRSVFVKVSWIGTNHKLSTAYVRMQGTPDASALELVRRHQLEREIK